MKVSYLHILTAATMVLLPAGALLAAEPATVGPAETAGSTTQSQSADDGSDPIRDFAARVGAWGVNATGSPNKVGEYQDLKSSPFWDADGLFSNGDRTVNFSATGSDNETTDGRLRFYYGPALTVDLGYERFPHELDAKTYPGFLPIPQAAVNNNGLLATSKNNIFYSHDDLSTGQDYAIRVQEFKANFKGDLTENIRWKVNVWGMEKEGLRQADAYTHCFQANVANGQYVSSASGTPIKYAPSQTSPAGNFGNQCHTISQAQHIDWQTTEVAPGIEFNLGQIQVEYTHTFRQFEQNDQEVFNVYRYNANPNSIATGGDPNALGFPNYTSGTGGTAFSSAGYNIVPDSMTQIDRIKIHGEISDNNDLYALGYVGYNNDELRQTFRHFGGADLRFTNTSIDGVKMTAYGKVYSENTETPTTALNVLYPSAAQKQFYQEAPALTLDPANPNSPPFVSPPINRDTDSVGFDARWRPFYDEIGTRRGGLAFTAGYEYAQVRRTNAEDEIIATGTEFVQPDTNKNIFSVGVEEKWSAQLQSYIRYKYIDTRYPLFGISPEITGPTGPGTATSFDDAINSLLPRQENRIEIGNTWMPTECLMVNGTFYIENAENHGPFVNFDSTSYPFMISAVYTATPDWSLNCGYADFQNWINQDVTLTAVVSGSAPPNPTAPWRYTAKADVFNIGSSYALTAKTRLTGDFEYVRGLNAVTNVGQTALPAGAAAAVSFQNPPAPTQPLGSYSLVSSNTYRVSAGVDYLWRPRVTTYFRYNYYDFGDDATGLTSGRAHMFLGGMTAMF